MEIKQGASLNMNCYPSFAVSILSFLFFSLDHIMMMMMIKLMMFMRVMILMMMYTAHVESS